MHWKTMTDEDWQKWRDEGNEFYRFWKSEPETMLGFEQTHRSDHYASIGWDYEKYGHYTQSTREQALSDLGPRTAWDDFLDANPDDQIARHPEYWKSVRHAFNEGMLYQMDHETYNRFSEGWNDARS